MSTLAASDRDKGRAAGTGSMPVVASDGSSVPPRASLLLVGIMWAGFVIGFAVALVALAKPRWFPILDLAQTEMRVRDVFTFHPPLIGLPGRIGTLARQGSHPGPLSFWLLAPFYKLFGSSAWALQAATASVNALAIGLSLLIARRRGGSTLLFGVGAFLAALTWFYGPSVLTQAWNPYLPMLWFIVVLLAVWSVLCDDFAVLPVATFAALFCLQTHISYLGLVGGLGGVTVGWLVWTVWRRREAWPERGARWIWFSIAIVVATSIPMVVQQFTHTPGNLTIIWDHFTAPPEEAIGLRAGLRVLMVHLNPWRLLAGQDATTGSVIPGVVMCAMWFVGAGVAIWRRNSRVVALNVVIAVALGLGALSIGNIFGFVWYYLMLWAWAINGLMLLSTGWSASELRRDHRSPSTRAHRAPAYSAAGLLLGVLAIAYGFGFALDASTVEPPTPRVSSALGRLVGPTVRAIESGAVPGGGAAGWYQITIFDPVTINAPGYGLLSELERAGLHAGFPTKYADIVRDRRVVGAEQATGVVHLSVGPDIAVWRAKANVVQVASADLRSPAERREFQRLRSVTRRELRAAGREDLVPNLDENIFTATFVAGLPNATRDHLLRMLQIGEPSAVFIGPKDLAE